MLGRRHVVSPATGPVPSRRAHRPGTRPWRRGLLRSALASSCLLGLGAATGACGTGPTASVATSTTSSPGGVSDPLSAGIAAEQAGHLTAAIRDYRVVLGREPSDVYALYDLGTVAQQQGRPGAAAADYRRALAVDPVFQPALYNLAIALAPNEPEVAISEYRRLERLDPGDAIVEFNLGVLLDRSGHEAAGESQILAAIKKEPSLVRLLPKLRSPSAKS